jgi:hypothetical protein
MLSSPDFLLITSDPDSKFLIFRNISVSPR